MFDDLLFNTRPMLHERSPTLQDGNWAFVSYAHTERLLMPIHVDQFLLGTFPIFVGEIVREEAIDPEFVD